jgi:ethanolamine utilization microcompartment shell protein EutS
MQMTRKIAKTYDNGATVEIIDLTPGEQCISLREVVYDVCDSAGNFIGRFATAYDASEAAQAA